MAVPNTEKLETIEVHVYADEMRMIVELAEADGVPVTDVIRLLVRRAYAQLRRSE